MKITGAVGNSVDFNIAGGLTANDVLYNVTGLDVFNQGGALPSPAFYTHRLARLPSAEALSDK